MMLRTAHVIRRFSFSEWGGTENVVWSGARRQYPLGVEAEIFSTAALAAPGGEIRDGVRIHRFPYRYPYFPMDRECRLLLDKKGGDPWCPALFRALERGNFDLIHVHSGGRLARMSALTARHLGIPCLITLHGGHAAVPAGEIRRMTAPVRRKFHYGAVWDRLLLRRGDPLALMDAIICLSREEQTLLRRKYPGKKIFFLPNGIEPEPERRRNDEETSIRAKLDLPPSRRIVLCVARIDYQKNQKLLIGLLRRTADTHLLLIGPVTAPWYRDEILAEVAEHGLEERFTLIPGLDPEDAELAAAYREADVFVLPSLHEPFGIAALEAWAWRLPLIAARTGGLKEIVRDGENGLLFTPDSLPGLLAAWRRLENTPGLKEHLGRNGRSELRHYEWSDIMRRQTSIYRELCGK